MKNILEIPRLRLNNGVEIPVIGNGPATPGYTAKYNKYNNTLFYKAYNKLLRHPFIISNWIDAVAHSFRIGFILLDNSAAYNNEEFVYKAIRKSGMRRNELFITTRATNKAQYAGNIREEFFSSLKKLHTDYVDLYQFHWPVTGSYIDTWKEMIKLYQEGYCRSIGVANCHIHHLEKILEVTEVIPAINQIEVHPLFTQKELISYCKEHGIQVEAYTAVARMDDRLVRLPMLRDIAKKYNKTIVQIVLRWHIQNGVIPIVRSLNKTRQKQNIDVFDFELSQDEMLSIDGININSRLRYDPDNCDFSVL